MSTYLQQMRFFFNRPNLKTVQNILKSYPSECTMAFRKQAIYWACENQDLNIFKEALNHPDIPECTNCVYVSMNQNQFAMLHFLIKKWKCNSTTIQKISNIIVAYIINTVNISFLDMWYIQCICFQIKHRVNNKIILGMAKMYVSRINRARKIIHKHSLKIVYDPTHPIGKKCFQNELDYINSLNIKLKI